MIDERPVIDEHNRNVGWIEGRDNTNPWGPEQGIYNAAYCDSGASMVPYHNGLRWWGDCQFGSKGASYCPYHIDAARRHGAWLGGRGVDLQPMDLVFYDWNGDGTADHVETVRATFSDGSSDNWAYNTGRPEGVHITHRDRRYLLGRIRMRGVFYGAVANPAPIPAPPPPPPPEDIVNLHFARLEEGPTVYLVSSVTPPRPISYFSDADYWVFIEGNKITEIGGGDLMGPDVAGKTRKGVVLKKTDNRGRELFGFPKSV